MMRATIDYGIDLGTTNSAIARQRGLETEVIPGEDGLLVPSVVHASPDGTFEVGQVAIEFRATDPPNTTAEFKRLMGTSETINLPAHGRSFSPAELSSKVLQHLIRRAERTGREGAIEAAVITIPAMFQLPQCEATKEAAGMAGLLHAPLLQEPIAAAIASAGCTELREGYWLIYDFGGGTFDVSLVRSRSGRLQVLDHDGDNHLGGKDFDRLLARRAADFVRAEGKLGEFRRSDSTLTAAFEKLRVEAERVRIVLSSVDAERFHVDIAHAGGAAVSVDFKVTKTELESLIRPVISRTIGICRQVLDRNGVSPAELKRLVLVGGPTLTPCLPAIIESDLGVDARHFVDPSKAVAIGAAIYASTQRIPAGLRRAAESSGPSLDLSYEPMTNDPRPLVAGQLKGQLTPGSWNVRISAETGDFASGPIALRAGSFATRVQLRPNSLNAFEFAVFKNGATIPEAGGKFSIIHGTTIAKPVLSQSVGVVLADNTVRWYLRKGVNLAARQTVSHTTTVPLRRGQSGYAVSVPLIQGENENGDRNTLIGVIQIHPENLSRDLPAGSEVIVTLSVDEHSTTSAEAYVPLLGQTFRQIVKFGLETRSAEAINDGVKSQRERLAELQKMADSLGDSEGEIDVRVRLIEELLEEGGSDERNQAGQLLRKVTGLIDALEVKDKEASLIQQFVASSKRVGELLGSENAKRGRQLAALSIEFQAAIDRADLRLAEAKFKAVQDLEYSLLREQPGFWRGLFDYLCEEVLKTPRASEARIPIDEGKAAINKNDNQGVIQACLALIRLLPQSQQRKIPDSILSTVA
jgi:molecular chaperone DnaK